MASIGAVVSNLLLPQQQQLLSPRRLSLKIHPQTQRPYAHKPLVSFTIVIIFNSTFTSDRFLPVNDIFAIHKKHFLLKDRRRYVMRASNKGVEGKIMDEDKEDGPSLMDDEERREWRRKIREVIDNNPNVEEEEDPEEKKRKMQKLLADYPLVVDEEDPEWPEDADGWGFNLGQFFDKITIKNNKKDADDEGYDSDKEIVWQDDNYIRPIKEITTKEWEEIAFKDISPLVVFVHNRYKRPKENEKVREELEKVAHIFWNCGLPSPRCVAVDAVVEFDLVSALKVSVYPEVIFIKAGKILYREKEMRTADELSKIMAFFYYGAVKPTWLEQVVVDDQELIPSVPSDNTGQQ